MYRQMFKKYDIDEVLTFVNSKMKTMQFSTDKFDEIRAEFDSKYGKNMDNLIKAFYVIEETDDSIGYKEVENGPEFLKSLKRKLPMAWAQQFDQFSKMLKQLLGTLFKQDFLQKTDDWKQNKASGSGLQFQDTYLKSEIHSACNALSKVMDIIDTPLFNTKPKLWQKFKERNAEYLAKLETIHGNVRTMKLVAQARAAEMKHTSKKTKSIDSLEARLRAI